MRHHIQTDSKGLMKLGICLLKITMIAIFLIQMRNYVAHHHHCYDIDSFSDRVDFAGVEQLMPKEKRPEFKLDPNIFHVVIHSHEDVGWRFNFDDRAECFRKHMKNWIEYKPLLWPDNDWFKSSVSLVAFLHRYLKLHPQHKEKVDEFIQQGKLEITGCGISEPDMATVYYDDLIENYEYGREICKELNVDTRIGWDEDAFGGSSGVTRLLSEMGYDYLFLSRVSNELKQKMSKEGKLTFNWKNQRYRDLNLMTQVYINHYDIGPGLNDALDSMTPAVLDPRNPRFKGDSEHTLRLAVTDRLPNYHLHQKNAVLMASGDFFFCGDANGWKDNFNEACPPIKIQRIRYLVMLVNSNWKGGFYGNKMTISSFNAYVESVQKEKRTYKEDEAKYMMPLVYLNNERKEAWTGFFTTHSGLKHSIRQYGLLCRGVMQYVANEALRSQVTFDSASRLYRLVQESGYWVGFMSHHDAVTGTSFIGPTKEYLVQMQQGVQELTEYLRAATSENQLPLDARLLMNQELTYVKGSIDSYYMVMNQDIEGSKAVRVACSLGDLAFLQITRDAAGSKVETDKELVTCDESNCLITFRETFHRFEVKQYSIGSSSEPRSPVKFQTLQRSRSYTLKLNARVSLEVLVEEHTLKIVEHIQGVEKPVSFEIQLVERSELSAPGQIGSGFYSITIQPDVPPREMKIEQATFRQTESGVTVSAQYLSLVGPIYIHFVYDTRSDRLNRFKTRLNFQKFDQNMINRSYYIRYIRDEIKSGGEFTSDTNGIESDVWTYKQELSFAENLRPVTRFIGIRDKESRRGLWVLIDRAEGGLSPRAGVIEVALVRYVEGIGGGGLPESVFEPALMIEHYLLPYSEEESEHQIRRLQIMEDAPLIVGAINKLEKVNGKRKEGDDSKIQEPGYLRSLIAPKKDGILLRLYNLHETEDITIPDVAKWAQKYYGIKNEVGISERTLDYNNPIEYVTKYQYAGKNSTLVEEAYSQTSIDGGKGVILKPLRTRTYRLIIKNE